MAVSIYIYSKLGKTIPSISSFNNFLPLDWRESKRAEFLLNNREAVYYWSWDDIFDAAPLRAGKGISLFEGISNELQKFDKNLNSESDFNGLHKRISTGCSYIKTFKEKVFAFVSLAGSHSLVYLNNEDYFVVATHIGLIGSFNKLTLRKKAIMWLAGRYHLADFETMYNETMQVPVGSIIIYSKIEDSISIVRPDLGYLFNDFSIRELDQEIKNYIVDQESIIRSFNIDFGMTLSGGKDSRAILSLFDRCGVKERISRVTTNGYNCSPEVMAAKAVLDNWLEDNLSG